MPDDTGWYREITDIEDGIQSFGDAPDPQPTEDQWKIVCPTSLSGRPVPQRRWIVEDWLPCASVTINFGDGGTGKTLLAQQLMTSAATRKPWCGLAVEPCKSLALFCEDDEQELHRRQNDINIAYEIYHEDLAAMNWISGVGIDNTLVTFNRFGICRKTARFEEFSEKARSGGYSLIVIDTAADTFGGNENTRIEVRQFVGATLGRLAIDTGAAVLLNAHPSRTGLAKDGDLDGGSTAWSNTARTRWSTSRPKPGADEEIDKNVRELTRRKANYASIGDTIKLRWERGVLVPVHRPYGIEAHAAASDADSVFMDLLSKTSAAGRLVSVSKNAAGKFAPKMFAQHPDRRGFSERDLVAAMERLFAAGRIKMEEYGRPGPRGKPRRMVAVEAHHDG